MEMESVIEMKSLSCIKSYGQIWDFFDITLYIALRITSMNFNNEKTLTSRSCQLYHITLPILLQRKYFHHIFRTRHQLCECISRDVTVFNDDWFVFISVDSQVAVQEGAIQLVTQNSATRRRVPFDEKRVGVSFYGGVLHSFYTFWNQIKNKGENCENCSDCTILDTKCL